MTKTEFKRSVLVRGRILGKGKPQDLLVKDGRVASIKPAGRARPDAGSAEAIIGPTLFDIQVNGIGGVNLQGPKVVPEDLARIGDMLAASGVSHWIPTIITGSQADMEYGCRVFAEALSDPRVTRAVPGVHLEGPYISAMDGPRGAHAKEHVRPPDLREFDRFMKAADGRISYITIAPELEGAVPFIKAVVKRGVVVSLGHHHANAEQITRAVDAGARLCTHLGNGMAAQIQRHLNPIWPQLAEDRLSCSLIADLAHLPEAVLKTFVRVKGPERVILTSDVVHITGLKPGRYDLGGVPVELTPAGRICLLGTELLAGSSLELLQGVVNAARHTDLTLEQAFACASSVPARLLGLRRRFDAPKAGKKADFVVFDTATTEERHAVRVRCVFIDGKRRA